MTALSERASERDAARRDPRAYHDRNHAPVPMAVCFKCGRDKAVCRTKIALATLAEADEWVAEFNQARGWASGRPVCRYPCHWCPGWHMKTAYTAQERARAEKARRRWLRQLAQQGAR